MLHEGDRESSIIQQIVNKIHELQMRLKNASSHDRDYIIEEVQKEAENLREMVGDEGVKSLFPGEEGEGEPSPEMSKEEILESLASVETALKNVKQSPQFIKILEGESGRLETSQDKAAEYIHFSHGIQEGVDTLIGDIHALVTAVKQGRIQDLKWVEEVITDARNHMKYWLQGAVVPEQEKLASVGLRLKGNLREPHSLHQYIPEELEKRKMKQRMSELEARISALHEEIKPLQTEVDTLDMLAGKIMSTMEGLQLAQDPQQNAEREKLSERHTELIKKWGEKSVLLGNKRGEYDKLKAERKSIVDELGDEAW